MIIGAGAGVAIVAFVLFAADLGLALGVDRAFEGMDLVA